MEENIIDINELIPDDINFNKGTKRGGEMIDYSLSQFGAGRSILIDKNNRIIAGNKTTESAKKTGITQVRVIEVSGDELIAVKRKDIDLDTKKGREMALADNVTAQVNFNIDYDKVRKAMDTVELHPEIWNVTIPNEQGELSRYSGGENKTIHIDSLKFGVYDIVMTPQESKALHDKAESYRKEHSDMKGFIGLLIKEYNERRNS